MTVATFDWGLGGLDVHRRLARHGLDTSFYLSDAGSPPYGTLSAEPLAQRVTQVLGRLRETGCSHVMVGCNAACTVLDDPDVLRAARAFRAVLGVVEPTVQHLLHEAPDRVTVIGGVRTVASEVYAAPLRRAGIDVRQRTAQPLSALVEAGVRRGRAVEAALDAILEPVRDTRVLVLGCTHYPALRNAITASLPRLAQLVDPAALAAEWVAQTWPQSRGARASHYETTGDPGASEDAARAVHDERVHFVRSPLAAAEASNECGDPAQRV